MSHPANLAFMESRFEAGAEAEIETERQEMEVIPPKHITDPDDEENIDH